MAKDIYEDSLEPKEKPIDIVSTNGFDVETIAKKIYYDFKVNQVCKIAGHKVFANDLIINGEKIIEAIRKLDEKENMNKQAKDGRARRKYRFHARAVGGPFAHKMFRWEKRIIDNEIIYIIWRIQ